MNDLSFYVGIRSSSSSSSSSSVSSSSSSVSSSSSSSSSSLSSSSSSSSSSLSSSSLSSSSSSSSSLSVSSSSSSSSVSVTPNDFQVTAGTLDLGLYEYTRDHSSGNECYEFKSLRVGMGYKNSVYLSDRTLCGLPFYQYATISTKSYARFTNVNVEQGATIVDAKVSLYNYFNSSGDNATFRVSCEDVDDGTHPQNSAGIVAMPLTSNKVAWYQGPQYTSRWYESQDISLAVQEVINRPGWVSGNHLNLIQVHCNQVGKLPYLNIRA